MLSEHEIPQSQLLTLKNLLNCESLNVLEKAAGGNSKVYCVEANGKKWAVKSYPPYAPNQRDRLSAEKSIYEFLNQHQVPFVPHFKEACSTERLLIIDWIEGSIPSNHSITTNDIQQAIAFLKEIAKLNASPFAKSLPAAAEACLSLDIIIEQIQKRFDRLNAHVSDEPLLKDFLENTFRPLFKTLSQQAKDGYHSNKIASDSLLPANLHSLIPADFGFHNSLRDKSNQLHFFDFDYFGWDDPAKLLADILWHPKMSLTDLQQQEFIQGISQIYPDDLNFMPRFQYTFPLYGLRWSLILLNEFIPAFWQNRQHAEAHSNLAKAKERQLGLALALTAKLVNQK